MYLVIQGMLIKERQYHNVLFVFDTIPFNMHQRSSFDCGNLLIWLPVNSFDKIPIKINLIGLLYNFRKIYDEFMIKSFIMY